MQTIFISATMRNSGQSLVSWLLAKILIDKGLKVGLFRPVGIQADNEGQDPLVKLLFDVFGDQLIGDRQCPLCVDPEGGVDTDLVKFHLPKIQSAFEELKNHCDICLAIGSRDVFFDSEQSALPDTRFIEMFDARVVLIDRFVSKAMTVYSSLALASFLQKRLAGIIINRVPNENWEAFSGKTIPFLKQKGAPIMAVLPEDAVISSPTLKDITELFGAKVLCCEDKLDRLATGKTIGVHQLPKSMRIYKRVVNKIILTGGSVEKISTGSTEDVCGIVLTHGRLPAESVVESARKEGLPVILTELDTYAALEKLDAGGISIKARDGFRLDRMTSMLFDQIIPQEILSRCGV